MNDISIGHSSYGGEFICGRCGKCYDNRGHKCLSEAKYLCKICKKGYGTEHALITHQRMRNHLEEK